MNFDYRFGTESTFQDWVNDGLKKAEAIINAADLKNKQETDLNPEQSK